MNVIYGHDERNIKSDATWRWWHNVYLGTRYPSVSIARPLRAHSLLFYLSHELPPGFVISPVLLAHLPTVDYTTTAAALCRSRECVEWSTTTAVATLRCSSVCVEAAAANKAPWQCLTCSTLPGPKDLGTVLQALMGPRCNSTRYCRR